LNVIIPLCFINLMIKKFQSKHNYIISNTRILYSDMLQTIRCIHQAMFRNLFKVYKITVHIRDPKSLKGC